MSGLTTSEKKATQISPEQKRREKILETLLKNYEQWRTYVIEEGLYTISQEGEEFHFFDILDGLKILPPRQRQAVWLMCIMDLTEETAARMMGFEKWSTPVQTYRRLGIRKLLAYHDNPRSQKKRKWKHRELR